MDGRNVRGPSRRSHPERERYRHRRRRDGADKFTWPRRTVVDIENMARNAFTRIDDIHNDAMNDGNQAAMNGNNVEEDNQWNEVYLENLVQEST